MKAIPWAVVILLVLLTAACSDDDPLDPDDGALVFSPSSLPAGTVGDPYTATITVSGQYTPVFEISVPAGTLPAGLQLVYEEIDDHAVISGTPQSAGTTSIMVSAYCFGTNDPGQEGHKAYSIVVEESARDN